MPFKASTRFPGGFGFAVITSCLLFSGVRNVHAATAFYGPAEYLSSTNSPFQPAEFNYFYLETFEDGQLNTPGVSINSGWVVMGPGNLTDSVDADDGIVDGSGTSGYALLSSVSRSNLVVTFDTNSLGGHLPTHVGIVCTDIGAVLFGQFGVGAVTFEAYDPNGVLLESLTATNLGNGSVAGSGLGATSEDRFFGVSNTAGIASVTLTVNNSVDWEVDHLQYGYKAVAVVAPELRIWQAAPDEIILAWPTNVVGFTLQESTTLSETNWTTVPTPSTLVGGERQVTVTPLPGKRFFRLIGS